MSVKSYAAGTLPRIPVQQHKRRTLVLLASVLSCVALASCSTPGSSSPSEEFLSVDGLDLEPYSHVTAKLNFENGTVVLPVQTIERNSSEVMELALRASHALIDSCLAESGIPAYVWPEAAPVEDDRLYGLWSISFASKYGFDFPPSQTIEASEPLGPEQERCFGEAREELLDIFEAIDSVQLDNEVRRTAYAAVKASPEGKAAIGAAQACMSEQGLSIDSESGLPLSDSSAPNSETNIRIAVIQATCNVDTGAIQTLYDLTAQYQAALMEANEAAAVALADEKANIIADLTRIANEE